MSKDKPNAESRLHTRTDPSANGVPEIAEAPNGLVADAFALFAKTENFRWHVFGPHFRDFHLPFDDQASQVFNTVDALAERVRKLGAQTMHSRGEMSRCQTIQDNDAAYVAPEAMLVELMRDNEHIIRGMRAAHDIADNTGTWRRHRSGEFRRRGRTPQLVSVRDFAGRDRQSLATYREGYDHVE